MFLVAAYDFAGTIIIDIVRTENGFGIVRSEWIEFLQVAEEFRSDVSEINLGIDVDDGACLFRQDICDTNSSKRSIKAGTFSTFMERPAA